ncbi:MAG: hypothetical protein WC802_05280 [Patescibacteria group bacterium]
MYRVTNTWPTRGQLPGAKKKMRINMMIALAFVTGCSDTYNTYVTNYYETDTDMTDSDIVDSDAPDTDVIDFDTDVNDCQFMVDVIDNGVSGQAILGNEVHPSLSSSSPSGSAIPGRSELLRFNVSVPSSSCSDISLQYFEVWVNVTDNANTDWFFDMGTTGYDLYNLTLDGTSRVSRHDADQSTTFSYFISFQGADILIPAGSTSTFAVYADTTGASSSQDDSIRLDLGARSMFVSDGTKRVQLDNDVVTGGTLVY